jgi:hypothetical protein
MFSQLKDKLSNLSHKDIILFSFIQFLTLKAIKGFTSQDVFVLLIGFLSYCFIFALDYYKANKSVTDRLESVETTTKEIEAKANRISSALSLNKK